ncbi:A/G-specific adenine glycosylase [Hyphococcus sp.]|uniref:A/G-specific adenine glycosylase n=1 Tax=Hyphococcus sp. TaxID=2038636 RepID=UPI003CCB9ED9
MASDTLAHKNAEKKSPRNLVARRLLRWYDKNARDLPWRVGPKARQSGAERNGRPDPYAVWLSEIMLQQTTVATVTPRYAEFLKRWPTVEDMAAAPLDDILGAWAGLGYYARARNLHKCAVEVATRGGFPDTEEELKSLPGVGDYTAAAIAAIAFDRRAVVVDGNIERVVSRLFAIDTPMPAAKPEIKERAGEIWPAQRSGDFAQAMMDLGAQICRPKSPACLLCPVSSVCEALALGRQPEFPRKAQKKPRPNRKGAVFALVNTKGAMLFERRPEKGLLGGMLGLPGTAWTPDKATDVFTAAPASANWNYIGKITHVFTHFHLTLDVYTAPAPKGFRRTAQQQWIAPAKAKLPTVMKKAVGLASEKKR